MKNMELITTLKQATAVKNRMHELDFINIKEVVYQLNDNENDEKKDTVLFRFSTTNYKKSAEFLKSLTKILMLLVVLSCNKSGIKPKNNLKEFVITDCSHAPIESGYLKVFTRKGQQLHKIIIDRNEVPDDIYRINLDNGDYIFQIKDDYGKKTKQMKYIDSNTTLINC